MICPRCFKDNVSPVNDTHFICLDPDCTDDNGNRTQFRQLIDDEIRFPYSQIFRLHKQPEFYRLSYLKMTSPGEMSLSN